MNEIRDYNGDLKAIELELHMTNAEAGPGDTSRVMLESCDWSAPYHGERLTLDMADEDIRKHFGGRFKVTVSPMDVAAGASEDSGAPAFADLCESNAAMVPDATCDDLKAAWEVGDELRMHLRASEDGRQPEQDAVWVVMGFDEKRMATGGGGKSRAVIGLKDGLYTRMAYSDGMRFMNSAQGFASMLPKWFVNLFATTENPVVGSCPFNSVFWFPSEVEVFGCTQYSDGEMELADVQLPYYKGRRDRRVKRQGANGSASNWWERSPRSGSSNGFCIVDSGGSADWNYASISLLLAPAGCF